MTRTAASTYWASLLADITETPTGIPHELHHPTNQAKVNQLATDMAAHGWQGPPLVVDGEAALTGSHRIAAHVLLVNRDGIDVHIPRVQIGDVFAMCGLDWAAHVEDHNGNWYEAVIGVYGVLPADLIDYLGLDAG